MIRNRCYQSGELEEEGECGGFSVEFGIDHSRWETYQRKSLGHSRDFYFLMNLLVATSLNLSDLYTYVP